MYEDLVKELQDSAEWANRLAILMGRTDGDTHAPIMRKAADVIKELTVQIRNKNVLLAEAINERPQWIPVTERLPEEPYGCLAIVWDNPRYDGDMFLNYYPEFVGWDGETWNDADGEEIPLDVVYWMKMPRIPEPQMEGE